VIDARAQKRVVECPVASGEIVSQAIGASSGLLTLAERRVADVAAPSLIDRQSARDIYLSAETIEMHLR
jgi:DNA-binding CsgD family transcriptional regulator